MTTSGELALLTSKASYSAEQEPQQTSPFPDGRPPRLLLVDDEPINIKVVRKHLVGAGYREISFTSNAAEVLPLIIRTEPDVVLLDIVMPGVSGLDLLRAIRSDAELSQVPVIMLTALDDQETKCRALELGATDFLAKPLDASELILRVRNVLMAKAHSDHLKHHAAILEQLVKTRTAELEAMHHRVVHCLARAAEYRDDNTGRHVLRVGRYAGIIARQLGWDETAVETLEQAAQLHDVGKIGIPDALLSKPGKLTPQEFELMQKHCGFGHRVFEALAGPDLSILQKHSELGSRILGGVGSPVLDMAAQIALTHHEHWDGSGYPIGLTGEDIPIAGRVTAVADVFDALSTKRCYKPAFSLQKCFEILDEGRGTHFDPRVLDAFRSARDQIVAVQLSLAEVS